MTEPEHILQKLILEQNSPSVQYILFDSKNIIRKSYQAGLICSNPEHIFEFVEQKRINMVCWKAGIQMVEM